MGKLTVMVKRYLRHTGRQNVAQRISISTKIRRGLMSTAVVMVIGTSVTRLVRKNLKKDKIVIMRKRI